ncbi:hypothetical protein RIF29_39935 [Crotalaria pallida]|uniref:Uncharacterized protein n=1 Tax=Crotalaria pallida TaxID=3830 RepID=A0AAN9HQ81_CROPI
MGEVCSCLGENRLSLMLNKLDYYIVTTVDEVMDHLASARDPRRPYRLEEYREGRNLLDRCDKLLNSIAEITVQQPSPVSVLDSSFYRDDSCSPSPITKRCIDYKGLHEKHQLELDNLTLTTLPFKTLKFFTLAFIQYIKKTTLYLLSRGGWLMLFSVAIGTLGIVLMTFDGPHEKHLEELLEYFRCGLWWTTLGVASSIGLVSSMGFWQVTCISLLCFFRWELKVQGLYASYPLASMLPSFQFV